MLLTIIFALLGVVLIVGVERTAASDNPMLRVGAWFFGAVVVLICLSFLINLWEAPWA